MTHQNSSYWERACHFFRSTGFADSAGTYFIHNKNDDSVKIGIQPQISIAVDDEYSICTKDGERTVTPGQLDEQAFARIEDLLRESAPCFFAISPDINRRFVDKNLPQILLVQPAVEFTFSPDHSDGQVSYARDAASEQRGLAILQASLATPLPVRPSDLGNPGSFAELTAGWVPAENDETFLERIFSAVAVLQDHPDGKMVLTRAYERRLTVKNDPFALYESHSRLNGEYACSHFFCLQQDVFSLGATPENVVKISDRTLTVDVVAATCKATDSDEYLARELYENPKQLREHQSSLANRQNRFRPFCEAGSIQVTQDMRIKSLRNVCHLHSVFTGELLPQVTIFDLLGTIFPLLGARPKELLALADAEKAPHRYYGGIVGHLHATSGDCFLNIRNALLDGDTIHAKVGVGIIKESDPHSELLETHDKLSGLLEAIHSWEQSRL